MVKDLFSLILERKPLFGSKREWEQNTEKKRGVPKINFMKRILKMKMITTNKTSSYHIKD